MQLRYRGVAYESTSKTELTVATEMTASFRGQTYSIHRPLNIPHKPQSQLVYRGIPYTH
jgi:hypothetical protein